MMKADTSSIRGERKVELGSFGLLRDFNFNEAAPLSNTLFVKPIPAIDRVTGVVEVTIPEIFPEVHVTSPKGATHFRMTAGVALVNLDEEAEQSVCLMASSDYQTTKENLIETVLTSTLPVFGISFYQEVNTLMYPMNNGSYNALCTIAIDLP
ncbi:MAG: hypothetical protein EON51_17900 [Acinetobacter sp.]|nr:MAG: hypothetical protein EON51_17900 [Acinetobacter sp.]